MARLTITLPNDLHRALKEAAARRSRTIGDLVAESLAFYGIKPETTARELVARARDASGLSEKSSLEIATRETRQARNR